MMLILSDTTIGRSQSKENTSACRIGRRHQGLAEYSLPLIVLSILLGTAVYFQNFEIFSACMQQDVEELMSLPPEKVLLKWMNFHLKKAGYKKPVTNFSSDLKVKHKHLGTRKSSAIFDVLLGKLITIT